MLLTAFVDSLFLTLNFVIVAIYMYCTLSYNFVNTHVMIIRYTHASLPAMSSVSVGHSTPWQHTNDVLNT